MNYIWNSQNPQNSEWLANKIYKTEHKFENYLITLPPKLRNIFVNYRLCNNKLPIETGRWLNIDRNLRRCILCNKNNVGDEFHYVFECSAFDLERDINLPFICKTNANCILFAKLFNENNIRKLRCICKF